MPKKGSSTRLLVSASSSLSESDSVSVSETRSARPTRDLSACSGKSGRPSFARTEQISRSCFHASRFALREASAAFCRSNAPIVMSCPRSKCLNSMLRDPNCLLHKPQILPLRLAASVSWS